MDCNFQMDLVYIQKAASKVCLHSKHAQMQIAEHKHIMHTLEKGVMLKSLDSQLLMVVTAVYQHLVPLRSITDRCVAVGG